MSKIKIPSDAEDARIKKGIKKDRTNPAWTAADFKKAQPATKAAPEIVAAHMTYSNPSST